MSRPPKESQCSGGLKIVYSPNYNISFFGVERLHPFDSRKYGRAWNLLRQELGDVVLQHHLPVDRPATHEELLMVHSPEYLKSLRSSRVIAAALEIPLLQFLPGWLPRWRVLRPMRWAVRGSVIAARAALQYGAAINLSGGYHHAKPNNGEGFSIYSDIALIVEQLRHYHLLHANDSIAYVDLDAHQGNGVCHQFLSDRRFFIFDMYNRDIYPGNDFTARNRINANLPLPYGCTGHQYLSTLREQLPVFLDSLNSSKPRLIIYNAGTDVFAEDKLGGMCLSAEDVLERDLFATRQFQQREIPYVMLLSGGYSQQSYQLVANTVAKLLQLS